MRLRDLLKSPRPTPARPAPADDGREDKGNGHSLEAGIYAFDSFPDSRSLLKACRDIFPRNDMAIGQGSFLFFWARYPSQKINKEYWL